MPARHQSLENDRELVKEQPMGVAWPSQGDSSSRMGEFSGRRRDFADEPSRPSMNKAIPTLRVNEGHF